MSRRRKAPPLPAWATLSKAREEEDSTIEQEDAYLRTCAYRSAHDVLERALSQAMDAALASKDDTSTSFSTLVAEILDSKGENSTDTATGEEVDEIYAPFVITAPNTDACRNQRFPEALPLITLEGPFSAADRRLWMQHLMTSVAKRSPQHRVILWTNADSLRQKQEEEGEDTIVFIHDDSSSFLYTNLLSDVLQSLFGNVAAVVLLLPTAFRRPIQWRCSVDLDVRKGVLPTSEAVLDFFWEKIKDFCIPFGDTQALASSFYSLHRSVVGVVQGLQRRCLLQLRATGSFWLTFSLLPPSCKRRANSLLFDKSYRDRDTVTAWMTEAEIRRINASIALLIQRKLWEWNDHPDRPAFMFYHSKPSPPITQMTLDLAKRRELISLLFPIVQNLAQFATAFDSSGFPSRMTDSAVPTIRDAIAEVAQKLVVVIDQCTYVTQLEHFLFPLIHDFTHASSISPVAGTIPQLPRQPHRPRQEFVQSLLSLDSHENTVELGLPGCLYSIVLDQYSITETDWFHAFLERYQGEEGKSHAELFRVFGCGVRHLQECGLMRSRKTAKYTIFEKAATVWCGGEEG